MTPNRLINIHTPTRNNLTETDTTMFTDNSTLIAHDLVTQADGDLAQTGTVEKLAQWRSDDGHTNAGRTPAISDRAVLVALLLLAREHSSITTEALATLFQHRLTTESEEFLDLNVRPRSPEARTERQRWHRFATNAFRRMTALMEPFPQTPRRSLTDTETPEARAAQDLERETAMKARLNEFTAAFLQMSLLQQPDRIREETAPQTSPSGRPSSPHPPPE